MTPEQALYAEMAATVAMSRPKRDELLDAAGGCTGDNGCPAPVHVHGCFADYGDCDDPAEHGGQSDG